MAHDWSLVHFPLSSEFQCFVQIMNDRLIFVFRNKDVIAIVHRHHTHTYMMTDEVMSICAVGCCSLWPLALTEVRVIFFIFTSTINVIPLYHYGCCQSVKASNGSSRELSLNLPATVSILSRGKIIIIWPSYYCMHPSILMQQIETKSKSCCCFSVLLRKKWPKMKYARNLRENSTNCLKSGLACIHIEYPIIHFRRSNVTFGHTPHWSLITIT